jgi:hypothetical protein
LTENNCTPARSWLKSINFSPSGYGTIGIVKGRMMKCAGGNIRRLHDEADIGKAALVFDAGVSSELHRGDHASSWSVALGSRLARDDQSGQKVQPFLRETKSRNLRRLIHSILSVGRLFLAFPLNSLSESVICDAVGVTKKEEKSVYA